MSILDRPSSSGISGGGVTGRQAWGLFWLLVAALFAWLVFAVWPDWLNAILISKKAFVSAILNGITLAGLYFLVASGFTLIFGLMRNVNLAHGSLYLLGAYIGYEVTSRTGYWLLGVAAGFAVLAIVGVVMQVFVFRRLEGDDLRQTLVSIGISIVAEGAETEAELESLSAIGCDQVQGYSIAFPMPQDKAREWLVARNPRQAKRGLSSITTPEMVAGWPKRPSGLASWARVIAPQTRPASPDAAMVTPPASTLSR